MAATIPEQGGGDDPLLPGAFRPTFWLGPDAGCPPEFADVAVSELLAGIEAERRERAAAADGECLPAGFRSRDPVGPSQAPHPRILLRILPPPSSRLPRLARQLELPVRRRQPPARQAPRPVQPQPPQTPACGCLR